MDRKEHWQQVYRTKLPNEFSWFQASPGKSLALIRESTRNTDAAIIDIGGGDSTLVDAVLRERIGGITVLDISRAALERAQARLGAAASNVTWIESDVTTATLPSSAFDVWHDRAVFHFLTEARDRQRYVARAAAALKPGGALIIATFAADGPTRCSGLECVRYTPESLTAEFGQSFSLRISAPDTHRTPGGTEQRFLYALFTRA